MAFPRPPAFLLVLALLTSAASPALAGPGDGDDGGAKKEKNAQPAARVLPLHTLMVQPLPPPGGADSVLPLAERMRAKYTRSAPSEPSAAPAQARRSQRAGSAGRYVRALGSARFPAWNLPPQVGNRATFYANVAYGQVNDEFDESGDMRSVGEDVPQFAGPIGRTEDGRVFYIPGGVDTNDNGRLDPDEVVTRRLTGQPQVVIGLQEAAELVDALDADAIPPSFEGEVYAGGRLRGTVNTFNVNLGGSYNLLNSPTFSVGVGADMQFSQQNFQTDEFVLDAQDVLISSAQFNQPLVELGTVLDLINTINMNPDGPTIEDVPETIALTPEESDLVPESVDSGFNAQALTLFLQAKNQLLNLRTAFQIDLGPSPRGSEQREVTDRQNALLLGLTLNYPVNPKLRTYFGVDGWFTLPSEEDQRGLEGEVIEGLEDLRYDEGNTYAAQVGADYALPFLDGLAVGAGLTFRWRTRATIEEVEVANAADVIAAATDEDLDPVEPEFERHTVVEDERGYNLGLAPYLNYAPPGRPFTLYLKGGVRDEYREFSFSILGENEFAPRAGATLGAVYNF